MNYITTKKILESIFVYLIILFLWVLFESKLVEVFDNKILPYLSNIEFDGRSHILFFTIVLFFIYAICKCFKNKYHIPLLNFSLLFFVVVVYLKYRLIEGYISTPIVIANLGYTDILIILLAIFVLSCMRSFIYCYSKEKKETNFVFIPDLPINKPDSDILDYSASAEKLAEDLKTMQVDYSCSIGLIAPWGTGKTSYLNLLGYYLNKDKFIVVKFNPRHSYCAKNIQEDFFENLFSVLKAYDSRFSSFFKNYLKAINIISDSKIIPFLLGIHKIWNKESEKEQINHAILRLNKRIVVIIEDFDRLLSDEVIEVFKLIDGNASFTNMIFITAYDKIQLNSVIGKAYPDGNTLFSDKFFTIEIPIPLRPYNKIYDYLEKHLFENINISYEDKNLYKSTLENYYEILEKYIITLRDAKRFLNLFIRPYKEIKDEVEFKDYFLLYLIKYKYLDEYLKLYKQEIVSPDSSDHPNNMFLKKELSVKSKDIMDILFPSKISPCRLRSINNAKAFDIYFYENVYGHLKLTEMNQVFDIKKDYKAIVEDINSRDFIQDFISFLDAKNILLFQTKETFERYIDVWLYLYIKNYEFTISRFKILALIYVQYAAEIKSRYQYEEQEYKTFISNKLKGHYPEYPARIVGSIIMGVINNEFKENIIFNKEEIQHIAIDALEDLIGQVTQVRQLHIDLLYSCISDIDQESRIVSLDQGVCHNIRQLIEENPSGYFENFVRLGMISSNENFNSVACEPFWAQLFGNEKSFKAYIYNQNEKSIPHLKRVKNFWKLYENNSYKPIEFENQGNVQNKIDNDLVKEVKLLNILLEIESKFNEYESSRKGTPSDNNVDYWKKYKRLIDDVDKIGLYITKTGDVKRKIQNAISEIR